MKYKVKYEDIIIGKYIVDNNNTEYIFRKESLKELKEKGYDLLPIINHSIKGRVPFFDNRIKNCKRFPGKKIGYHTDGVTLEEIKMENTYGNK